MWPFSDLTTFWRHLWAIRDLKSIDANRDDDDELRRESTGSRTSFTAGKLLNRPTVTWNLLVNSSMGRPGGKDTKGYRRGIFIQLPCLCSVTFAIYRIQNPKTWRRLHVRKNLKGGIKTYLQVRPFNCGLKEAIKTRWKFQSNGKLMKLLTFISLFLPTLQRTNMFCRAFPLRYPVRGSGKEDNLKTEYILIYICFV